MNRKEKDIAKFIENKWNLKDVSIIKCLQNKGERIVYKILTNKVFFIFKLSNSSKKKENIIKDTYIFDYAKKHKFAKIPEIQKSKSNQNFEPYKDRFAVIMSFIDSGNPKDNPKNWKKIGKITAELHNLKDYKYKTSFTPESEKEHFLKTASEIPFGKEYMELVEKLPNFKNCSKSIIHTDIGIHNIVKDKNNNFYFIDWDDVGTGITILDLGFPLLSQFLDHNLKFHEDNAKAFYNEYFKYRTISNDEMRMIFDAGLFFALIYLPYGNISKNWKRINFAIDNKEKISSVL